MNVDIGLLQIHKIIIHELPRKLVTDDSNDPVLSETDSPLDVDLTTYFVDRLKESAGSSSAFDIRFQDPSPSSIPDLIRQYLNDDNGTGFVGLSQTLALRLHDVQNRLNPPGLLAVIECTIGTAKGLAILKVEKEEGLRLDQRNVDGKKTFDIKLIRDLLFTKRTKLFKLALFVLLRTANQTVIQGIASDRQRGSNPKHAVADFFLSDFLGCDLAADAKVTTKRFYEVTEAFINIEIDESIKRAEVVNHLLSQLTNNVEMLNPDGFARECLPPNLRQQFADRLAAADVPMQSFAKDLELIQARVHKTLIEFQSGIQLLGKPDDIQQHVNMEPLDDGSTEVTIVDRISKVRGK